MRAPADIPCPPPLVLVLRLLAKAHERTINVNDRRSTELLQNAGYALWTDNVGEKA